MINPYQYTPYNNLTYPTNLASNYVGSGLQPIRTEITKVSGRNGAEAFQMSPNSSALLLDESAPLVWLKTTDGAGYPTITPYSITPYQPEQPIDTKNLEARISRLEELLNEQSYSINDEYEQNVSTNKPSKEPNASSKRSK